ncbi:MAG: hypothetical protein CO032_04570 [Nitrosopumilales archaeon CG_4_9_14_0_2_um_filter_34_16]|nr:MAG: hypothetical protein CO032_04570 [Nitrosopumilales archaeon CG_4_9_14_0_2_um_filter_34_16]
MTTLEKRNHYNVKLLRGYGVSISLKNSKIILKNGSHDVTGEQEKEEWFVNKMPYSKIVISGKGIQKHWKGQIKQLEKLHPNDFSFLMNFDRKMNRWDFHMTDLAILIPLFFIVVWGLLIAGFNLHFVFNII